MQIGIGDKIIVDGLDFVCYSAFPESYSVYVKEKYESQAWVSVKYGKVRCWYDETILIYEHQLEELQGAFYKHRERLLHLRAIAKIINERLTQHGKGIAE